MFPKRPHKEKRVIAHRKMRKGLPAGQAKTNLDLEQSIYAPESEGYRVWMEHPGHGFRHILKEKDIRRRLGRLPPPLLRPLHLVYLPRMTKRRRALSCYGMADFDTGTIYLYPVEEGIEFAYGRPLTTAQRVEYRKFGAKIHSTTSGDSVKWTEQGLKRYFADNVLIHELGHLLDFWNGSYRQRERWAEHFANYWGPR